MDQKVLYATGNVSESSWLKNIKIDQHWTFWPLENGKLNGHNFQMVKYIIKSTLEQKYKAKMV